MIELLTSISIIGILAAILVPTLGAVQRLAKKKTTENFYGKIAQAMESYRLDYGHYPIFPEMSAQTNPTTGDVSFRLNINNGMLYKILSGAKNAGTQHNYNVKQQKYLDVPQNLLTDDVMNPLIQDSFGDTDIAVVVNTSGMNEVAVKSVNVPVTAADGGPPLIPPVARNIPQRILIYSMYANKGTPLNSDFCTNWLIDAYKR